MTRAFKKDDKKDDKAHQIFNELQQCPHMTLFFFNTLSSSPHQISTIYSIEPQGSKADLHVFAI